jgi:hypothetical protein
MPRNTPPPETTEVPEAPADTGASPSPGAHVYIAPYPVTYPHIPLTCRPGDVWAWPDATPPADGRWEPTDLPVNTSPDNEPRPVAAPADTVEEG